LSQLCRGALGGNLDDIGLVSRLRRSRTGRCCREGRGTNGECRAKSYENEAAKLHDENPFIQRKLPKGPLGTLKGYRYAALQL
jgi:hypothetical protein